MSKSCVCFLNNYGGNNGTGLNFFMPGRLRRTIKTIWNDEYKQYRVIMVRFCV